MPKTTKIAISLPEDMLVVVEQERRESGENLRGILGMKCHYYHTCVVGNIKPKYCPLELGLAFWGPNSG